MRRNGCSKVWTKVCVAGLLIAGGAMAARADENDQYWLTGGIKGGLTSNLTLKVSSQQRYRDEDHYYKHMDYGVDYKLSKNWSVCGTFRDQSVKSSKGEWRTTSGYLFDVVNSTKGLGMELKSRMRFTYFDPHFCADCSTDFRPRFDLLPAKGFTLWKLKPYVADEIMYNFDDSNLYRNRLSFGLKCNPMKKLTLDLSLMNEKTETNGAWSENWNTCLAATWLF
jgi:hypothetical protein